MTHLRKWARHLAILILLTGCAAGVAAAAEAWNPAVRSFRVAALTAHDMKALHYVRNAHEQLDEWSYRLLDRLRSGKGPRRHDPVLDGRARMQVQRMAVTYAGSTRSEPLRRTVIALAEAHDKRLRVLQAMTASEIRPGSFEKLDTKVQELAAALREKVTAYRL